MVGRRECKIWRRRCAGSDETAERRRGVTRMGRGLIQEVTLSSMGSKELRRE